MDLKKSLKLVGLVLVLTLTPVLFATGDLSRAGYSAQAFDEGIPVIVLMEGFGKEEFLYFWQRHESWFIIAPPGYSGGSIAFATEPAVLEMAPVQLIRSSQILFWVKVTSGRLKFLVNGEEVAQWESTEWKKYSLPLPSGSYYLRWEYDGEGQGEAWLDDIWIIPEGVEQDKVKYLLYSLFWWADEFTPPTTDLLELKEVPYELAQLLTEITGFSPDALHEGTVVMGNLDPTIVVKSPSREEVEAKQGLRHMLTGIKDNWRIDTSIFEKVEIFIHSNSRIEQYTGVNLLGRAGAVEIVKKALLGRVQFGFWQGWYYFGFICFPGSGWHMVLDDNAINFLRDFAFRPPAAPRVGLAEPVLESIIHELGHVFIGETGCFTPTPALCRTSFRTKEDSFLDGALQEGEGCRRPPNTGLVSLILNIARLHQARATADRGAIAAAENNVITGINWTAANGGVECLRTLGILSLFPTMSVDTTRMEFDRTRTRSEARKTFRISNSSPLLTLRGRIAIQKDGKEYKEYDYSNIPGRSVPVFTVSPSTFEIPPQGSSDFTVIFTPTYPGKKEAKLIIYSNDPKSPLVEIPLVGEASGPYFWVRKLQFNKREYCPDDYVQVTAFIENTGDQEGDENVRMGYGYWEEEKKYISSSISLKPGHERDVSFGFTTPGWKCKEPAEFSFQCEPGAPVAVIVTYEDWEGEHVPLKWPGDKPYFKLSNLKYPGEIHHGGMVEFSLDVENTGCASGSRDIVLKVKDERSDSKNVYLSRGEKMSLTLRHFFSMPGYYSFSICAYSSYPDKYDSCVSSGVTVKE